MGILRALDSAMKASLRQKLARVARWMCTKDGGRASTMANDASPRSMNQALRNFEPSVCVVR